MPALRKGFVTETTNQTKTGDTNFTTELTLASADWDDADGFVSGRDYLIVCMAQVNGDDRNGNYECRLARGATPTVFNGATFGWEQPGGGGGDTERQFYFYWTVYTPGTDDEDVVFQMRVLNSGDTVAADQISIFALELSVELTDGTDYHFNENTTNTTLSGTWSTTNNATVTFTPGEASDWLVFSRCRIINTAFNTAGTQEANFSRIQRTGEASSTEPQAVVEGEDTTNDAYVFSLARVFSLTAASNTFTEQAMENGDETTVTRTDSGIFALNLDSFVENSFAYSETEVDPDTGNFATEVESTSFTATGGDYWFLGTYIADIGGGTDMTTRLQVDNSDDIATQTADAYPCVGGYDGADEVPISHQAVSNHAAGTATLDIDVGASGTSTRTEDHLALILLLETPDAAADIFPDSFGQLSQPLPPVFQSISY